VAELLQDIRVKNRGIWGDRILGIISRLKPIVDEQPKKIFIEIGSNDVASRETPQMILENYKLLLDTLQTSCKKSKLYVQSIFPVRDLIDSDVRNVNIRIVNQGLENYCKEKNITYIDVYTPFTQDMELIEQYSVDGWHLSGEGYILWAKILKPFVAE
jgi:lysophospholipase L1-like esterase